MGDTTSNSEIGDDDMLDATSNNPCNTTSAASEKYNANEASPPIIAVTKEETMSCDELKDSAMVSIKCVPYNYLHCRYYGCHLNLLG